MGFWQEQLETHKDHETFRSESWPITREMGFTCRCSGIEQEWRLSMVLLKELVPSVRASLMGALGRLNTGKTHGLRGSKKEKRNWRKANARAKALLHRHLPKHLRWDFRASKSFEVIGQDGWRYLITEGSSSNVWRIEPDGSKRYRLCVVPTIRMPIADTLLAQKLLLEADIATFLRTARVFDVVDNQYHESGEFLYLGVPPAPKTPKPSTEHYRPRPFLTFPDEVLDDPTEWVQNQLRSATGAP